MRTSHHRSRRLATTLGGAVAVALVIAPTGWAHAAGRVSVSAAGALATSTGSTAPTLTITSQPMTVAPGSPATVAMTVSNPGTTTLNNVRIDLDIVATTVLKVADLTLSYPSGSGSATEQQGATNQDVTGYDPASQAGFSLAGGTSKTTSVTLTVGSGARGPLTVAANLDQLTSTGSPSSTSPLAQAVSNPIQVPRATPYPVTQQLVVGRASTKSMYYANPNGAALQVMFGTTGDEYLAGDLMGSGDDFPVDYRPSTKTFYLADESTMTNGVLTIVHAQPTPFGTSGDIPLLGNFNPDSTLGGFDEFAVYRPSNSTFYVNGTNGVTATRFGTAGDIPLVGNWDGSSAGDHIGVYRPSDHTFYLSTANGTIATHFGTAGDTPIVGDWNGAGTTLIGVHRGNTFIFADNNTNPQGSAPVAFGSPTDVPTVAFAPTAHDLIELADNATVTPAARRAVLATSFRAGR